MNLNEVHKRFSEDEQCLQYIAEMRWPDGIVRCPTCGNDKIVKVERAATSKNRRKWFYLCQEPTCHQHFSPTSGTIFQDTHLPLIMWFQAIALVLNAKKGLSAKQLQRDLGIGGYKTAWYLYHRIREAMEEGTIPMLGGTVEIDETYVGGRKRKIGIKAAMKTKQVVMGAIERGGKLRLKHVISAQVPVMRDFIDANVSLDVDRVMTDQHPAYPSALGWRANRHFTVNHIREEWVKRGTDISTNTIESAFSLFKRGIIGNFHKVSIQHLQRYLNEFSYRYNRRKEDPFTETVARLCGFKPLPYRVLISE